MFNKNKETIHKWEEGCVGNAIGYPLFQHDFDVILMSSGWVWL